MNTSPVVSVGLCTYNRPESFKRAIECITRQTYKNLEIIVSNNNTVPDEADKIVEEYKKTDARITYYKQGTNLGPASNFEFVLEKATSTYFMWAADDDRWEPTFIEECMKVLVEKPEVGMAFTNINAIDVFGRVYRDVPSFAEFSCKLTLLRVYRFLVAPEFYGKANLLYGVFKTDLLRQSLKRGVELYGPFSDVALCLFMLVKSNVLIVDKKLFNKTNTHLKNIDKFEFVDIYKSKGKIEFKEYIGYSRNNLIAVRNTGYYGFVKIVMVLRLLFDKTIDRTNKDLIDLLKIKIRSTFKRTSKGSDSAPIKKVSDV